MARVEPAFKLKTANLSVFVLHINTTDMAQLKQELDERYRKMQGFFSNSPVVLDLSAIATCEATLDFSDLLSFMLDHGMRASGVIGGSDKQRSAAARSGLGLFTDPAIRSTVKPAPLPIASNENPAQEPEPRKEGHSKSAAEKPVADKKTVADKKEEETQSGNSHFPGQGTGLAQPVFEPGSVSSTSMLIDKPVRTGQRIYAKGASLVVLAAVNAGSELIADGDIHIYAPLRGRAIAGANGNEKARIFTSLLEAELISIAGCFKVFENGIPENLRGKPVQAFLDGPNLVIRPLQD